MLVVVFVVALPGLTEEGTVQVKLGADTFTVGQARPKAESIAADGPFLFSDVANGQRDIYVQHLGDDPLTGWSAFDARLPGAGAGLLAAVGAGAARSSSTRARARWSPPTAPASATTPSR